MSDTPGLGEVLAGLGLLLSLIPIILWIGSALFAGYVADQKGYAGGSWFLLAIPFGFVALIAVVGLPVKVPREVAPLANGALIEQPNGSLSLLVNGETRLIHRRERRRLQTMNYEDRLAWYQQREAERSRQHAQRPQSWWRRLTGR